MGPIAEQWLPGLLWGSGAGTCNSLGSFDVAQVFGGGASSLFLEKTPFVEGLSYNLNTMQYPSQPFQPSCWPTDRLPAHGARSTQDHRKERKKAKKERKSKITQQDFQSSHS